MNIKKEELQRLDHGLNAIFRSKNNQIMLSRIHEHRDFSALAYGQEPVQVITPNRKMFTSLLTPANETNTEYLLTPINERPPVRVEDSLLILFQSQGQSALSQAQVVALLGAKVRVSAVDPRVNIRYKTRIAIRWRCISTLCREQLQSQTWTLLRKRAFPESFLKPVEGVSTLVDDFISKDGTNPLAASDGIWESDLMKGLIVDLSVGGFCILTSETKHFDAVKSNIFIEVQALLPHVSNDYAVSFVIAVRHVRAWKNVWALHCMYVEPLAPEVLVI